MIQREEEMHTLAEHFHCEGMKGWIASGKTSARSGPEPGSIEVK
jgi:hypothetical protein